MINVTLGGYFPRFRAHFPRFRAPHGGVRAGGANEAELTALGLLYRSLSRYHGAVHREVAEAVIKSVYVPWAVQFHPQWGSIRLRPITPTCAPPGVRVGVLAKSRNLPTRNVLPHFFVSRQTQRGTAGEPLSREPVCRHLISLYYPYSPCKRGYSTTDGVIVNLSASRSANAPITLCYPKSPCKKRVR